MKIYITILASIATVVIMLALALVYNNSRDRSPDVYFKKGKRNFELARYNDAINDLNEYLSINKKFYQSSETLSTNVEEAQFMIASSLRRLKKNNLSKEMLINIIMDSKYDVYVIRAVLEYADVCRIENYYDDLIIARLQQYLRYPKDPVIEGQMNMQYGYQMLFKKKYGDALVAFLRANGELAVLGRARVYFEMQEYDRTFEVYEDFIRYYPMSQYIDEISRTYRIQVSAAAHREYLAGKYSKARFYYEKLSNLFPNTEEAEVALLRIGHTYFNEKRYAEAVTYYTRVRNNNIVTSDAEATLFTAISYFKMDKFNDSYKMFDSFIYKYPNHPNIPQAEEYMKVLQDIIANSSSAAMTAPALAK